MGERASHEHRLLRRLKAHRIDLADVPPIDLLRLPVDEDLASNLGLLFRALAPMRNREHMAGGRRYRSNAQGRGRLLARHDDAPQIPAPRADGAALSAHRSEGVGQN